MVHGIGQQERYQTLDAFARGLFDLYRARLATALPEGSPESDGGFKPRIRMYPERVLRDGSVDAVVHIDVDDGGRREKLSIFEFYWAPYMQGKVSYLGVLLWLLRTALGPILQLRHSLRLRMMEKQKWSLDVVRAASRAFFTELFRAVLVYLPFAAGVVVLLWFFVHPPLGVFERIDGLAVNVDRSALVRVGALALTLFFMAVLGRFALATIPGWKRAARSDLTERAPSGAAPAVGREGDAERVLFGLALIVLVALAAAGGLLAGSLSEEQLSYLSDYLVNADMGKVLALILLLTAFKKFIVNYIGDVTVYTTGDEKSEHYEARLAILSAAVKSLEYLLSPRQGFDRVIIAGHSLGSVIAYDALNRISLQASLEETTRENAADRAELSRLRGLVTFGSPLDKIYYFFHKKVPEQQAVRGQLLPFLFPFARRDYRRDFEPYRFRRPDDASGPIPSPLAGLPWLNVWSSADFISGHLDFYEVPEADQVRLFYPQWGFAHLSYWDDPRFYSAIGERFFDL